MQVLVAGATGVVGWRLVSELVDRDHGVAGLAPEAAGEEAVAAAGGEPRRGDVLDPESLRAAAAGADVVVHAAGGVPACFRPDRERAERVLREGARNLVAAAEAVGADRYVQCSDVRVARQPDGSRFAEGATPHPDPTTRPPLDAERAARDAEDVDVAVLRCGLVYGPDAPHARRLGRRLLARRALAVGTGLLGRGDADLSLVHAADAARALADAACGDRTGLWHVVDDEPVPYAAFLGHLADRLDAPPPRRVPAWLARHLLGSDVTRVLAEAAPTTNRHFAATFGWEPRFPDYRAGLIDVVGTWHDEGTLVRTEGGYRWDG